MRKLFLFLLIAVLAGCRGANNADMPTPNELGITMNISVAPNPPIVGEATLVVSLQTPEGEPINDAAIKVRGDMNHAGMQPVFGESSTGREGDYQIPFEWTMGGDWFVIVTAELANGEIVEQQFDYTVEGEMNMEMPATEEVTTE